VNRNNVNKLQEKYERIKTSLNSFHSFMDFLCAKNQFAYVRIIFYSIKLIKFLMLQYVQPKVLGIYIFLFIWNPFIYIVPY